MNGLNTLVKRLTWVAASLILLCAASISQAMSLEQALSMVKGSNSNRIAAINDALISDAATIAPFFKALEEKRVYFTDVQVFVVNENTVIDAVTGRTTSLPADASEARVNNRIRKALRDSRAGLRLFSDDRQTRLLAAQDMASNPSKAILKLFERARQTEEDKEILAVFTLAQARVGITSENVQTRLTAAQTLGQSDSLTVRQLLRDRLSQTDSGFTEADPAVRKALNTAYAAVEYRIFMSEIGGTLFAGISLGSVLLLAALGLAITYGLMGVINLAHGELIMIGAYATYLAQEVFRNYFSPHWFDAYLILAIPMAFLCAAAVGALLERFVIRHLYGRELETLLATWGISLILMQGVRNLFGAQNVSVENPSWMSGGLQVTSSLVLPYNRIAIIVFSVLVLIAVGAVISRTRLGLFVRATIQNRTMARCVGVPTKRTDLMAFSLGSGVAGLAGCALSQIGNVGPDLGQGY
ncbi:MAG: urea ABC transporter permease subunit UrtB, partial [Burkholderiaceae bacterium]